MATPSSDWTFKHSTETYERPFASSETSYGTLLHYFDSTGTYCYGITFETSNVPRATVVTLVREAIGRFRFYSPMVACNKKISQEQPLQQSFVYKPISRPEEVMAWVDESLMVEASRLSLNEYLSQRIQMRLPYVHSNGHEQYFACSLVLHEKEDVYYFIGHVSHGFIDGRPFLNLMRFVLDTIVSPNQNESVRELPWGTEWKNLPDCPGTLARQNTLLTDCDWDQGWKEVQSKLDKIYDRQELGVSLKPSNSESAVPGLMTRTCRQIDETTLTSIKNELKTNGYNMSILIPAAHILTIFQKNQPLKPDSYITLDLNMIDTARFFSPQHSGPFMASSRTAFAPLTISAKDVNWDATATIRDQLMCIMKILDEQVQDYLRYPQLTLIDTVGPRKPDVAPLHPHTCILSYIGVVDSVLPPVINNEAANVTLRTVDFGVMHRHAGGFQRPSHIFWSFEGKFNMLIQGSDDWDVKCFEDLLETTNGNMLQLI